MFRYGMIIILSLSATLMMSCKPDPHTITLPADVMLWKDDPELVNAVKELPEEEQELLGAYAVRQGLASAFGGTKPPDNLTIADAIQQQRDWLARQPGASAEQQATAANADPARKSRVDALGAAVGVTVTKKGFQPRDSDSFSFQEYITFQLLLTNKTDKDVDGIKGSLLFNDVFGDLVMRINLSIDDGISANSTVVWDGMLDYNEFSDEHRRFRSTPLEKLHGVWESEMIVFSDGTTLDVND